MSDFSFKQLSLLLEPKDLLDQIIRMAVQEVGASSGSLMLLNPNTGSMDIEVSVGLNAKAKKVKLRMGEGVTGWVASTGKTLRISDTKQERRYVELDARVKSELAVPLDLNGQVIGVLNLDSWKKNFFNAQHEQQIKIFAKEASDWIKLAWDIEQLRVRGEQLETLVDMGQTIISQDHSETVLQRVAEYSCRLMKAKLSSLMLLSDNGEELFLKAWFGASREYIKKPNLRVSDSLVGVVVNCQKPLAVLNVQEHQQFQQTELARREGLFSLLSVPLVFQGKPLGVLSVYTDQVHRFSNEEIRLMTAMAGLSSVAIAKVQVLERVVQVEEELKASERLSALGWLAAEIAHEIRNPLTVIQMLFHSMMEEVKLDEGASRDAKLIETKMVQMNRILDQVLNFARSSEPDMELLEAGSLIDDIVLLTRHKVAEYRVKIVKRISKHDLHFRGDRAQVEQAILNLVLNACQSMPEGGIISLSVSTQDIDGNPGVKIAVKDTGQGMSKERQEELFQPFLSYRKGGTGLGLALVSKTVEHHRGKIKVSSKVGQGTVFELVFPAR